MCSAAEAGEYCLEIYANDPQVDGSSLYLVCQYLIVCSELVSGPVTRRALSALPPGFLGAQPNFRKFGLVCSSHDDPYIATPSSEMQVSEVLVRFILLLEIYTNNNIAINSYGT